MSLNTGPNLRAYCTPEPLQTYTRELEIKRSRFVTFLQRAEDETAARELVSQLRRTHHTARHHCLAFVCGPTQDVQRSSDDGEPSGTAGVPMLDVLRKFAGPAPLSDVVAVVVRYFGGIKLGAGGLTRAYAQAVSEALHEVPLTLRQEMPTYHCRLEMSTFAHVESAIRQRTTILATEYLYPDVDIHLASPLAVHELQALMSAIVGDAASLRPGETTWTETRLP